MKLHEYQAKKALKGFGIPVPKGVAVLSPESLASALKGAPEGPWVVKAQIHSGGRGKAGTSQASAKTCGQVRPSGSAA